MPVAPVQIPGIGNADSKGFKNIDYSNSAYKIDAVSKEDTNIISSDEKRAINIPEQIIEQAKNEASQIVENAMVHAEKIMREAEDYVNKLKSENFESSKKEGYAQGYDLAQREIAELKESLILQQHTNNEEFETKVCQLEKDIIGIVTSLIGEITGVIVENEDVLIHILHRTFMNIENSNKYIIKVSEQDYSTVLDNKEALYINVKEGAIIEVVSDSNLNKNQCLIETDVNIIDCSLDVQMKNVSTQLRLLSLE